MNTLQAVQAVYETIARSFSTIADAVRLADGYIDSAVVVCGAEASSFVCTLPGDAARKIAKVITKPFSRALEVIKVSKDIAMADIFLLRQRFQYT